MYNIVTYGNDAADDVQNEKYEAKQSSGVRHQRAWENLVDKQNMPVTFTNLLFFFSTMSF
jgi:hypothetical protein